jgi:hypothetical protein
VLTDMRVLSITLCFILCLFFVEHLKVQVGLQVGLQATAVPAAEGRRCIVPQATADLSYGVCAVDHLQSGS